MNYDKPENVSGGLQSPPAKVPDCVFENMFAEPPAKSEPVDIPQSNVYSDLANLYSRKKRQFLQQKSQK